MVCVQLQLRLQASVLSLDELGLLTCFLMPAPGRVHASPVASWMGELMQLKTHFPSLLG